MPPLDWITSRGHSPMRQPAMDGGPIHHRIAHRFSGTVRITTTCNVCERPMFLGYKCRDCKYNCHADCVKEASNSCEASLLDVFRQTIDNNNNNNHHHHSSRLDARIKSLRGTVSTQSSTNSIFWAVLEEPEPEPAVAAPPVINEEPVEEERPKSLISREWNIPFDDLVFERELGGGRFGAVFRGRWHGAVAIRLLNTSTKAKGNVRREMAEFESFRKAVAIYRKIRHDNLVLFMGASAKPPHQFAIVTVLCKGRTLHRHIHFHHEHFSLNRIVSICKQICQGMGYLHARAIVHKDLRTKNIFYENGNVTITDYGGLSASPFVATSPAGLTLPAGYLTYLAPEIIRALRISTTWATPATESLAYSFASDVFAFGTVLHELLLGTWPFAGQPAEAVIWKVGRGMKPALGNLKAKEEIKDLLVRCWAFEEQDRPDFSKELAERLRRLPKQIPRVPSHPVHLDKSLPDLNLL